MSFRARFATSVCRLSAIALCLLAAAVEPASAVVVRGAPDFTFPGPGNKAKSLRSLRGQPVVLLISNSPSNRDYRKQLKKLREIYSQFASRQAVFIVAFTGGTNEPVQSNVPFAIANNGGAVASAYGLKDDFCLVIIGKDGNVDYQTDTPATAQRIRDVIQNSYVVQEGARKPTVR